MTREFRFSKSPVRAIGDGEGEKLPKIEGYAAVYYDAADPSTEYWLWDDACERIMPGCFEDTIKSDEIVGLFNHEPDNLLGRNTANTLLLSTDAKGLKYTIDPPDTTIGRDVAKSLERGDLKGSSFAFETLSVTWKKEEQHPTKGPIFIRELVRVKLFDVGPVTYPAYSSTTAGIRSKEHATAAAIAERDSFKATLTRSLEDRAQVDRFLIQMDLDRLRA